MAAETEESPVSVDVSSPQYLKDQVAHFERVRNILDIPKAPEHNTCIRWVADDSNWDKDVEYIMDMWDFRFLRSALVAHFFPYFLSFLKENLEPIERTMDPVFNKIAKEDLKPIDYLQRCAQEFNTCCFRLAFQWTNGALLTKDISPLNGKRVEVLKRCNELISAESNEGGQVFMNFGSGVETSLNGLLPSLQDALFDLQFPEKRDGVEDVYSFLNGVLGEGPYRAIPYMAAFTSYADMEMLATSKLGEQVCPHQSLAGFRGRVQSSMKGQEWDLFEEARKLETPSSFRPVRDVKCPFWFLWNGETKENIVQELYDDFLVPLFRKMWLDKRYLSC